jgi:hypothetical protein
LTQTIQLYSPAAINDTDRADRQKTENLRLLTLLFDDLNNLNEELNRLNHILKRRNIEQVIHRKYKGEKKTTIPRPKGRGMVVLVRSDRKSALSRGLIPFLTALKGGVLNPSHTITDPEVVSLLIDCAENTGNSP